MTPCKPWKKLLQSSVLINPTTAAAGKPVFKGEVNDDTGGWVVAAAAGYCVSERD